MFPSKKQSPTIPYLLITAVILWAAILATFAIMRHQRLNSSAYDLAIKSQVIWNSSQGDWFASTLEVNNYLGDHVQPIMLLIAPLYRLWPDVQLLLIIQAVALSLGALPIYHIGQRHLKNQRLALLFSLVFLFYPALGFMNRFDFHPVIFCIPLLLFAFNAWENDRLLLTHLLLLMALLSKEEIGLTIFALGLYAIFIRRQVRLGLMWASVGLGWSLFSLFVIIPAFRGTDSDTLGRYAWLGADVVTQLRTLILNPGFVWQQQMGEPFRWHFLVVLLLPLGYLALLAPATLLIGIPALLYNLLSAVPSQSSIYFHYIAPFVPFAFIAAILGAARLRLWRPQMIHWIIGSLLLGTAVAWAVDNPFSKTVADPFYPVYTLEQTFSAEAFAEAKALLPKDASVATTMAFAPHLSTRAELYLFYHKGKREIAVYDYPQADYLLLHLSDMRWFVNPRIYYAMIETAVGRDGYEAIYYQEDVVLLQKTGRAQSATGTMLLKLIQLEEAGAKFAPTGPDTIAWIQQQWQTTTSAEPMQAVLPSNAVQQQTIFQNDLILMGYRLQPGQEAKIGGALCVILFWQAINPIPEGTNIFVHLNSPDGFVQTQRDSAGVLGFYPISSWPTDAIVGDMHCLALPTGLSGNFFLSAGVYDTITGERAAILSSESVEMASGAIQISPISIK
ncbi:MAG: DUF2079 domain-containing protein [Chloroflexi bacterium]|nr:DUF2079 domain-containing protein [Chloroflexota bacterium]